MLKQIKRFITGVDNHNESSIINEDPVDCLIPYQQFASFQLHNLFYTEDNPQHLQTRHLDTPYNINLPQGAMRFMRIRMPTKQEMIAELTKAHQPIPDDWTKFNLHSTDSVDYMYILSGSITCIVGAKSIDLSAGDFLAQIGPEHTWVNDHDEPCMLLCVMVGIAESGRAKKMVVK